MHFNTTSNTLYSCLGQRTKVSPNREWREHSRACKANAIRLGTVGTMRPITSCMIMTTIEIPQATQFICICSRQICRTTLRQYDRVLCGFHVRPVRFPCATQGQKGQEGKLVSHPFCRESARLRASMMARHPTKTRPPSTWCRRKSDQPRLGLRNRSLSYPLALHLRINYEVTS